MVSHRQMGSIQYYTGLWHKESGRPIMVNIKTPDPFFSTGYSHSIRFRLFSRVPTPTKSFIYLHKGDKLVSLSLDKPDFSGEKLALGIENIEVV